jgi:hypothetical protein
MQKWEYLEVRCSWFGPVLLPQFLNGQEIKDWKKASGVSAYLASLGEDGWELAGAVYATGNVGGNSYLLTFKRPKA